MRNVLVTGANGQLGNELRVLASANGAVSADGITSTNSAACASNAAGAESPACVCTDKCKYFFTDVAELDITDPDAISRFIAYNKIEVVINCAAYTNVDKAEDDEVFADKLNDLAVRNLALSCAAAEAFFIHISTDYVFDGSSNVPYVETDLPCPVSAYGRTKLAGEKSVLESGCGYIIIRTAWLYSEYGKNFVKTMQKLTSEKEVVNVVFDQVGTPTYAGDMAAVIFGIVEGEHYFGREGIYHYSNEGVCSWYDFAIAIRDAFYQKDACSKRKCEIRPCHSDEFPSKVHRPAFSVLDKTKIKETFGITVPHWTESLERCAVILSKENLL